jgi:flavodoxin
MKSVVVYETEYGNTRRIAEVIAEELKTTGPVEMKNVREAPLAFPADVGLLVVGGPTQMHGVSARLRAELDAMPNRSLTGFVAEAFDTRKRGPHFLTGSASAGIARRLRKAGATLVLKPASFLVEDTRGPLAAGEVERARTWASELIAAVPSALAATMAV